SSRWTLSITPRYGRGLREAGCLPLAVPRGGRAADEMGWRSLGKAPSASLVPGRFSPRQILAARPEPQLTHAFSVYSASSASEPPGARRARRLLAREPLVVEPLVGAVLAQREQGHIDLLAQGAVAREHDAVVLPTEWCTH